MTWYLRIISSIHRFRTTSLTAIVPESDWELLPAPAWELLPVLAWELLSAPAWELLPVTKPSLSLRELLPVKTFTLITRPQCYINNVNSFRKRKKQNKTKHSGPALRMVLKWWASSSCLCPHQWLLWISLFHINMLWMEVQFRYPMTSHDHKTTFNQRDNPKAEYTQTLWVPTAIRWAHTKQWTLSYTTYIMQPQL